MEQIWDEFLGFVAVNCFLSCLVIVWLRSLDSLVKDGRSLKFDGVWSTIFSIEVSIYLVFNQSPFFLGWFGLFCFVFHLNEFRIVIPHSRTTYSDMCQNFSLEIFYFLRIYCLYYHFCYCLVPDPYFVDFESARVRTQDSIPVKLVGLTFLIVRLENVLVLLIFNI